MKDTTCDIILTHVNGYCNDALLDIWDRSSKSRLQGSAADAVKQVQPVRIGGGINLRATLYV